MNKLKTLCIAALLLFTVNAAMAQDKYEYAVITFIPQAKDLAISVNGTDYKKIEVFKEEVKDNTDASAGLKQVNKMSDDGWEVFDTGTSIIGSLYVVHVFYLRKKVS